jgi:hypothetical protein
MTSLLEATLVSKKKPRHSEVLSPYRLDVFATTFTLIAFTLLLASVQVFH